jgi:flagellar biosynthesis protein FlhF
VRLRTFIATNMAEAIDLVRRELGPDAIIVSSFSDDDGRTEVTAAIETSPRNVSDIAPSVAVLPNLETSLERRLHDRLRIVSAQSATQPHSGIEFDESLIAEALDAHGVPMSLRDVLVAAASALGSDDAVAALAGALETRFNFEPIPILPRAPLMLVGLPGSGKTVTMAKLAANSVLENVPVELITTDTERAGAAAQGEAYGRLLDINVRPAENVDALSLLLEENADSANALPDRSARPCFIDTASINPFDRVEMASLKRLTEGARLVADAEPVLVLAATGDAALLSEVAVSFAQLGARRLIATQVDISRRLGAILAAADASHLSLAQISVTPYLARGLGAMNPTVCARLVLGTHEKRVGTKISIAAS